MQLVERDGFWIREAFAEQDLVIVRDIYQNDAYRISLIRERVEQAKLIVDVGAHIGCFARLVHEINPAARIVCVEAEQKNLEALSRNAPFATVVRAVCTYDPRPLRWWSAFAASGCESTGGGMVAPSRPGEHYDESDPPPCVTLERLRVHHEIVQRIDLLKLDCEGSEFSILANCNLAGVGFVVGEYHGREKWDWLREWRLSDWDYGHMSESGDLGNFHLRNPRWASP